MILIFSLIRIKMLQSLNGVNRMMTLEIVTAKIKYTDIAR